MANAFYTPVRNRLLSGALDLLTHDIKAVGVSSAYTFSAAHEFRSDLTGVIATSGNLAGKSLTTGVFDASDLTPAFTSVATNIVAVVLFRDTGVAGTSPLIAYLDTGTGFPLVQNGGNVNLTWDNGANKILALA